jgi:hypothetical protein
MRKFFLTISLAMVFVAGWAIHVPQQDAAKLATAFYRVNNPSGITNPVIASSGVQEWESVPALYIFRFEQGGFVLISADDAVTPVLAYSFENSFPQTFDENIALKRWLEDYCREIGYIVSNSLDNSLTAAEWKNVGSPLPQGPSGDVLPLISTIWDQGCYYNTSCPPDGGGPCGHALTGCVATCMAQIMKYHNYPPQGVGVHSYIAPGYGQQTVNYGNTTYNWSSMPNAVGSNNPAVATLMYHCGVGVNMNYGASASGAFSEDVPGAMLNYFNYHPDIDIKYKANYPNVEDFKSLLRSELDATRPMYYSGDGPGGGHAFVCDGYRMSDGKFHFNWGWSGAANGYFAIGNLNPSGYTFNNNNAVVINIKPYNSNLIVRISHPADKTVVGVGYSTEIKASVVRGTASSMKIFIDNVEKFSAAADSISYTWNTTSADLGSHIVKAYAYSATDTVYYKILLNVAEWVSQSTAFPTQPRAMSYVSAVDSNIVWGTAADGNNMQGACSDFARTTNGGNTWIPGVITNTAGLASAMIFALDSTKAYVAMYRVSGSKPMGVYMTADGGLTWTRQSTASFSNSASFPNVVHFFNANDGMAMGDPINNEFEIYTTANGGTTWTGVTGSNIPNPLSGEFGVVGYYSAVNDTIWFGTNKGRVYKSVNKGATWTVSQAQVMNAAYVKPFFRNGSHGLLQDESTGQGLLCESFDGGATWTQVNFTGPNYSGDISFVPGTANTWVRAGFANSLGCAYSFDGGHSWTDFVGTTGAEYMQMAWVNNHCGWSGGMSTSATENGVYRFIGLLQQPLPPPLNLQGSSSGHDVTLTWDTPNYDPLQMTLQGYDVYRDGAKLTASPVTANIYTDQGVESGQHNYCVYAKYNLGISAGTCKTVDVAVGIRPSGDAPSISVYPNPAHGRLTVKVSGNQPLFSVFDLSGNSLMLSVKMLQPGLYSADISMLAPGVYMLSVQSEAGASRTKVVVY